MYNKANVIVYTSMSTLVVNKTSYSISLSMHYNIPPLSHLSLYNNTYKDPYVKPNVFWCYYMLYWWSWTRVLYTNQTIMQSTCSIPSIYIYPFGCSGFVVCSISHIYIAYDK